MLIGMKKDLVFPVRHTQSMKRDLASIVFVFKILMRRSNTNGRELPPSASTLERTFVEENAVKFSPWCYKHAFWLTHRPRIGINHIHSLCSHSPR